MCRMSGMDRMSTVPRMRRTCRTSWVNRICRMGRMSIVGGLRRNQSDVQDFQDKQDTYRSRKTEMSSKAITSRSRYSRDSPGCWQLAYGQLVFTTSALVIHFSVILCQRSFGRKFNLYRAIILFSPKTSMAENAFRTDRTRHLDATEER